MSWFKRDYKWAFGQTPAPSRRPIPEPVDTVTPVPPPAPVPPGWSISVETVRGEPTGTVRTFKPLTVVGQVDPEVQEAADTAMARAALEGAHDFRSGVWVMDPETDEVDPMGILRRNGKPVGWLHSWTPMNDDDVERMMRLTQPNGRPAFDDPVIPQGERQRTARMIRVALVEKWLLDKHCTLWLNWTISDPRARREAAEFVVAMMDELTDRYPGANW